MPTKLKDLVISKVSFVDAGDNPKAHVVLFKRKSEPEIVVKDESLSDKVDGIRDAFRRATYRPGQDFDCWVREVYVDHVIAEIDGDYYSIPYSIPEGGDAGDAQFDMSNGIEVEQAWDPVGKDQPTDPDVHVPVPLGDRKKKPKPKAPLYGKRDFSSDQRQAAADKGNALPDGSFPIENVSDLKNAVKAYGRAKNKAAAKAHIVQRAKALGAMDQLPEGWQPSSKGLLAKIGRKIAGNRLTRLRDAQKALADIIAEAEPAQDPEPADPSQKRKEGDMPEKDDQKTDLTDEVRKSLPEEVQTYIAKVEADLAEAQKAQPDPKDAADPAANEDVLKGLDPAVRALVEKAQADAKEAKADAAASQDIAKAERDKRLDREAVSKVSAWTHLPFKADEFGPLMRKVGELAPEQAPEIERVLSAANEQLVQAQRGLFRDIGKGSGSDAESAEGKLNAMAEEIAKRDSIEFAAAYAKAVETPAGKALYEQHRVEKRRLEREA